MLDGYFTKSDSIAKALLFRISSLFLLYRESIPLDSKGKKSMTTDAAMNREADTNTGVEGELLPYADTIGAIIPKTLWIPIAKPSPVPRDGEGNNS